MAKKKQIGVLSNYVSSTVVQNTNNVVATTTGNLVPEGRIQRHWNNENINLYKLSKNRVNGRLYDAFTDVTTFVEHFNLHSVEFGNWMSQEDRLQFMYAAADSLRILAKVLGVPENALGLGNRLSIALGARGVGGKHLAHYESLPYAIINITKPNGDSGSFAHEFAHAVDNMTGKYLTGNDGIIWVSGGRSEQIYVDKEHLNHKNKYIREFAELFKALFSTGNDKTDFGEFLSGIEGYWKRRNEVLARTFENWVASKDTEEIRKNSMLCKDLDDYDTYVYPHGLIQKVSSKIKNLFQSAILELNSGFEVKKPEPIVVKPEPKPEPKTITLKNASFKDVLKYASDRENASDITNKLDYEYIKSDSMEGDYFAVFHKITGSHIGTFNLENKTVIESKNDRAKLEIERIIDLIYLNGKINFNQKQIDNLKDYPAKNAEEIEAYKNANDVIKSEIKALETLDYKNQKPKPEPKPEKKKKEIRKIESLKLELTYGKDTKIVTPSEVLPSKYAIAEMDYIQASNDPFTFNRNEKYPVSCQTRNYNEDAADKNKVIMNADKFDYEHLLNNSPDATTGSPIMTHEGIVLGGNGRTMILKRVEAYHPEVFEEYVTALKAISPYLFGISSEAIEKYQRPVLVRVIEADLNKCSTYSNILNQSNMQQYDEVREGIAVARQLLEKKETVETIVGIFDEATEGDNESATLNELLDEKRVAEKLISALQRAEIINKTNITVIIEGKNEFTSRGKAFVEAMFLGVILPEKHLITTARQYTVKILKAIPDLFRIQSLQGEYNIINVIRKAIELESSRKSTGMTPKLFLTQGRMNDEDAPDALTIEVYKILHSTNPKQFRAFCKFYADSATINQNHDDVFGVRVYPIDIVGAWLSGNPVTLKGVQPEYYYLVERHAQWLFEPRKIKVSFAGEFLNIWDGQGDKMIGRIDLDEMRPRLNQDMFGTTEYDENDLPLLWGIIKYIKTLKPKTAQRNKYQTDMFDTGEKRYEPVEEPKKPKQTDMQRRMSQARLFDNLSGSNVTESKEFKKWFGKSKIVDKNGQPLVVYHGTSGDFNEFDYSKMGKNGTAEGYGFYFTDKLETAERYKDTGKVLKCYLRITKPLNKNKISIKRNELIALIKSIDKTGDDFLSNYDDVGYYGYNKVLNTALAQLIEYNSNDVDLFHDIMNSSGIDKHEFYNKLYKIAGYDGIIINKSIDENFYVVFLPNNVKSIDNDGSFDIDDNSILSDLAFAAYHGSPHKFDKFTTEKIGSGEGAQAFGWGLYFTDKKDIAVWYRDKLTKDKNKYSNNYGVEVSVPVTDEAKLMLEGLANSYYGNLNKMLEGQESNYDFTKHAYHQGVSYNNDDLKRRSLSRLKTISETLSLLRENKVAITHINAGALYNVKIHGDKKLNDLNFMRWDEKITDEKLIKKLRKLVLEIDKHIGLNQVVINPNYIDRYTGKEFYTSLIYIFKTYKKELKKGYTKLVEGINWKSVPELASKLLLKFGIDGISYPAHFVNGGNKDGHLNYVVFDENAVEITHINDVEYKKNTVSPEINKAWEEGRLFDRPLADSTALMYRFKDVDTTLDLLNMIILLGSDYSKFKDNLLSEINGYDKKRSAWKREKVIEAIGLVPDKKNTKPENTFSLVVNYFKKIYPQAQFDDLYSQVISDSDLKELFNSNTNNSYDEGRLFDKTLSDLSLNMDIINTMNKIISAKDVFDGDGNTFHTALKELRKMGYIIDYNHKTGWYKVINRPDGNKVNTKINNSYDEGRLFDKTLSDSPIDYSNNSILEDSLEEIEAPEEFLDNSEFIADEPVIQSKKLNIKGKIKQLLGQLYSPFSMLVWGKQGSGKSSFALQLADDLSYNGKLLYVANEEKVAAQRIARRALRLGVNTNRFKIDDSGNFEEFINLLNTGEYLFVIIDSKDNFGKSEIELMQVQKEFPEISFIYISHSTKDGATYVGDRKFAFLTDVEIRVADGWAEVLKHRDGRNGGKVNFIRSGVGNKYRSIYGRF